jgi:hydrogenase maturation protein HypF
VLGPHIGDLDDVRALDFLEEAVGRLQRLLGVEPEIIAHDLHPDYPSTRWALARPEPVKIAVQHHHAHVVAAMAEHHLEGPVLGLAWDGTGLGTDGAAWGGELLLCHCDRFERLATFRPLRLPGGDRAIRQPWRIALALCDDAFHGEAPLDRLSLFRGLAPTALRIVRQMLAQDLNSPRAHGVGRLFDGLGALGLGRPTSAYEGQVATAWNLCADPGEQGRYPFEIAGEAPRIVDTRPLVRAAVEDLLGGAVSPGLVSARFHNTLVAIGAELVRGAEETHGSLPIVLSGGCFQNPRLAEGLVAALAGRAAFLHREVPPGDGGIALGQAVIAAAQMEGRS